MDEPTINEERMKAFAKIFENDIFPIIIGEDGKGLERLEKLIVEKRTAIEERNRIKEQNVTNERGDL